MKFIQWVTGCLLSIHALLWAAVIIMSFFYASEIGDFLGGVVDRFDYAIGYPGDN